MRTQFQSLASLGGLRIWVGSEVGWRLQAGVGSGVVGAVETPKSQGCSQKKKKKKKKREREREKIPIDIRECHFSD